MKYGNFKLGTRQAPKATDVKARLQRIEELKRMYREATISNMEGKVYVSC